jgi:hypothetical protein
VIFYAPPDLDLTVRRRSRSPRVLAVAGNEEDGGAVPRWSMAMVIPRSLATAEVWTVLGSTKGKMGVRLTSLLASSSEAERRLEEAQAPVASSHGRAHCSASKSDERRASGGA